MKRILSALLAVLCTLALTACGTTPSSSAPPKEESSPESKAQSSQASEPGEEQGDVYKRQTMTTGSILSRSVFTGSVQLAGSSSFFVLLYAAICEQVLIDVFYRKRISIRNDM